LGSLRRDYSILCPAELRVVGYAPQHSALRATRSTRMCVVEGHPRGLYRRHEGA
jgi:hypothetical protein